MAHRESDKFIIVNQTVSVRKNINSDDKTESELALIKPAIFDSIGPGKLKVI